MTILTAFGMIQTALNRSKEEEVKQPAKDSSEPTDHHNRLNPTRGP
jgi:hypothetical protein